MENEPPWGKRGDYYYFGKNGVAEFKRNSFEYDDFLVFFSRYALAKPVTRMNNEYYDTALKLFNAFQKKQIEAMKQKIERDRSDLPIKQKQHEIVDAVKNNRVVLVAADTGAGKSTQVPQYLMEAGFDNIACTQPRRIACYSLAKRVSYESLNQYGSEVAYQVRFDGTKTDKTKLLFLTEGVLLRQFAADPLLRIYNIIIIDEVHERHITGDFLLGLIKRVLANRLDLRIVLMSATINAELFSKYFDAPVIEVPGRMFPVQIEYHPVEDEDMNLTDQKFIQERKEADVKQSIKSRGTKIKAGIDNLIQAII
jgi:HrpA-like RNA helicase